MRSILLISVLVMLSCSSSSPVTCDGGDCNQRLEDGGFTPHTFDGGDCHQPLEDGGFTPHDPHELPCGAPGDTCAQFIWDDPCPTTCACGADGGWSCARVCPPAEPCRVSGYCPLYSQPTTCETYDAGCGLVCHCLYGHVSQCAVRCE